MSSGKKDLYKKVSLTRSGFSKTGHCHLLTRADLIETRSDGYISIQDRELRREWILKPEDIKSIENG